jgi:hypothetical protein
MVKTATHTASAVAVIEPVSGNCFHCDKPVGPDDFCYGCGKHVCMKCNVNRALMGPHRHGAHLTAAE